LRRAALHSDNRVLIGVAGKPAPSPNRRWTTMTMVENRRKDKRFEARWKVAMVFNAAEKSRSSTP